MSLLPFARFICASSRFPPCFHASLPPCFLPPKNCKGFQICRIFLDFLLTSWYTSIFGWTFSQTIRARDVQGRLGRPFSFRETNISGPTEHAPQTMRRPRPNKKKAKHVMITFADNSPLTQTKIIAYTTHGEENSNRYTKHKSQRVKLLKTLHMRISNRD